MGLFLGDSQPSKIFVGDTSISKVFLGDTQVRPSGGGGRLPSEYQEVEWIGSSGTQRIDTGYIPNNNTKAEWKMGNWTETGSHCIFGIMYGFWDNPGRGFSIVTDAYMFNNSAGVTHGMNDGGVHTGELSQAGLFVDGVLKTTPATSTFTCPNNLLLFCTSQRGSPAEYSTFRYYYYKLYDNGTLVRDFVPCYRIADGEIGMYDIVNDVFYTNVGSGTFTKGPNVSPGEGWQPGANTLLYMPMNSTSQATDQSGNNIGTTNSGVTFGTYHGVDCGQFSNAHIQVSPFNIPGTVTILVRCYATGYPANVDGKIFDARNYASNIVTRYGDFDNGNYIGYSGYVNGTVSFIGNVLNEWVLLAITCENGSQTFQLLGNNISYSATNNISFSSFTPNNINIGNEHDNGANRYFQGTMSNLIVENKVRTAQEKQDYYNQTKGDYGIS